MNEKLKCKKDTHSEAKDHDESPIGVYRVATACFKGREGKGREGKGREGKGREGKV